MAAEIKKNLKAISYPEMDEDALPSSFITKVLTTAEKWDVKLAAMKKELSDDRSEKANTLLVKYSAFISGFRRLVR